jgi:hypothetical protein
LKTWQSFQSVSPKIFIIAHIQTYTYKTLFKPREITYLQEINYLQEIRSTTRRRLELTDYKLGQKTDQSDVFHKTEQL